MISDDEVDNLIDDVRKIAWNDHLLIRFLAVEVLAHKRSVERWKENYTEISKSMEVICKTAG
jgi:hypothetical protein